MARSRPLTFDTVKKRMLACRTSAEWTAWERDVRRLESPDFCGATGVTLLMVAARVANVEAVERLLRLGANPRLTDGGVDGFTGSACVLVYAFANRPGLQGDAALSAYHDQKMIVIRRLLEAGASVTGPGTRNLFWSAGDRGAAGLLAVIEAGWPLPDGNLWFHRMMEFCLASRNMGHIEPPEAWWAVCNALLRAGIDPDGRWIDSDHPFPGVTVLERLTHQEERMGDLSHEKSWWESWYNQIKLQTRIPDPASDRQSRRPRI